MTAATRSDRWIRPLAVGLTVVLLIAGVVIGWTVYGAAARLGKVGVDFGVFQVFAQRWIDTGSMYLPMQLSGPFDAQPQGWTSMTELPSMYPPPAVFLFAPFLWLPGFLWWLLPIGAVCAIVARWRPAPWTWPVMATAFVIPATWAIVWTGGSTMWITAFVAGGLAFGAPGVLVLLKPSLAPFALAGVWRRSWWIALALWCGLALLMLSAWLDYVTVVRNGDASAGYSLLSLPMLLIPVVAWLGRRKGATEPHELAETAGPEADDRPTALGILGPP